MKNNEDDYSDALNLYYINFNNHRHFVNNFRNINNLINGCYNLIKHIDEEDLYPIHRDIREAINDLKSIIENK